MSVRKYSLKQAAILLGMEYAGRIYSVKEAAGRLGISDSHCRRLLEAGKIKGKKLTPIERKTVNHG